MLAAMFGLVLEAPGSLSPATLRTAHACATASGDEALLVALASRPDLPEDVEAALGSISSARVRTVWVSRPTLSAETLHEAAQNETRSTVRAAIARNHSTSAETLMELALEPHRAVALAVLQNDAASREAHRCALERIVPVYDELHSVERVLVVERSCTVGLLHDAQLVRKAVLSLVVILLSKERECLPPAAHSACVEVVVKGGLERASCVTPYNRRAFLNTVYRSAQHLLFLAPDDESVLATARAVAGGPVAEELSRFQNKLVAFTDGVRGNQQRVQRASVTQDVIELRALISHALEVEDVSLATALMSNPRVSSEDAASLILLVPPRSVLQVAAARDDITLAQAVLRCSHFEDELVLVALRHFGAPLVRVLAGECGVAGLLASHDDLEHLLPHCIGTVPLHEVWLQHSTPLFSRTLELELASLTPDEVRYATALERGWQGSLRELIATVKAIS